EAGEDRARPPAARSAVQHSHTRGTMRISVFGLGYVGCVSAACLASMGHEVVGVDVNPDKVGMINAGRAPIVEERIGELVEQTVREGRVRATTDAAEAVNGGELYLGCVGPPAAPD